MEYSTQELAKLSGVSTRTLRYYDQIGLLRPTRVRSSGYRVYGQAEVDRLQQILFYRALDLDLARIRELLDAPGFDKTSALEQHLAALRERRNQLDQLIQTANRTIAHMKGEITMKDTEKFEGFKRRTIEENEHTYGAEIRQTYGDDAVDASNRKFQGLSEEQFTQAQHLSEQIHQLLLQAMEEGDPAGETAHRVCTLHEQWLRIYTPNYTLQYHKSLGDLYVQDERFQAYYDRIAPGCAAFLRNAIYHYCN